MSQRLESTLSARRLGTPWRPIVSVPRRVQGPCRLGPFDLTGTALKLTALVSLTLQAVAATALIRMTQSRIKNPEEAYFISSMVTMVQALKVVACLLVMWVEGWPESMAQTMSNFWSQSLADMETTFVVGLVALVYVIQNYLLVIAGKYLDTTVFLVTNQLKTISAAFFAVFMAKRTITATQWASLLLLVVGVGILQISIAKEEKKGSEGNTLIGLAALIGSATLSGYAGTALELVLKDKPDMSVWGRSLQLAGIAFVLAIFSAYAKDGDGFARRGFFHGYDFLVWACTAVQGLGGLLIALVLKYADNVVKSFATAMAIVLSAFVDAVWLSVTLPPGAIFGTVLVVIAIFGYTS